MRRAPAMLNLFITAVLAIFILLIAVGFLTGSYHLISSMLKKLRQD